MIAPDLGFWWRLFTALAVQVCCLAVLGLVAQRLARSAFWRRTAWQTVLVCLLAAAVSEWTGIGRALADHFAPRRQAEEYIPAPDIVSVAPSNPVYFPIVALPPPLPVTKAKAVWWPGLVALAGTILVLGRTALAQGLLLVLRFGRGKITDGPLRERLALLSPRLGLRRKVSLRRMPALMSPMAFGIMRPCIGLPARFEPDSARRNKTPCWRMNWRIWRRGTRFGFCWPMWPWRLCGGIRRHGGRGNACTQSRSKRPMKPRPSCRTDRKPWPDA